MIAVQKQAFSIKFASFFFLASTQKAALPCGRAAFIKRGGAGGGDEAASSVSFYASITFFAYLASR